MTDLGQVHKSARDASSNLRNDCQRSTCHHFSHSLPGFRQHPLIPDVIQELMTGPGEADLVPHFATVDAGQELLHLDEADISEHVQVPAQLRVIRSNRAEDARPGIVRGRLLDLEQEQPNVINVSNHALSIASAA